MEVLGKTQSMFQSHRDVSDVQQFYLSGHTVLINTKQHMLFLTLDFTHFHVIAENQVHQAFFYGINIFYYVLSLHFLPMA